MSVVTNRVEVDYAGSIVQRCGETYRHIMSFVPLLAAGHSPANYWEKSGDKTSDAVDVMAEYLDEMRQYIPLAEKIVRECAHQLNLASRAVTPTSEWAGFKYGHYQFNHAHEAIVGVSSYLECFFRAFGESAQMYEPLDIEQIRMDIWPTCEAIVQDKGLPDSDEMERLMKIAEMESSEALRMVIETEIPSAPVDQNVTNSGPKPKGSNTTPEDRPPEESNADPAGQPPVGSNTTPEDRPPEESNADPAGQPPEGSNTTPEDRPPEESNAALASQPLEENNAAPEKQPSGENNADQEATSQGENELEATESNVRAYDKKLFPKGLPKNQDLIDAIVLLQTERTAENTDMSILRKFTGESVDDCPRAMALPARIRTLRKNGRTTLPKRT